MVALGIQGGSLIRRGRGVADPDVVLDQPFVDGFRCVCHKNSAFKICLAEDIWESRGMVDVKTR
jgi:hypothetical protein